MILTLWTEYENVLLPTAGGLLIGLVIWSYWFAIQWGAKAGKRNLKQMYKKRENNSVNDFVIRPADDGAMELMITKKVYKKLRAEPLLGVVEGKESAMIFRLGVL